MSKPCLIFATSNQDKAKELRDIFPEFDIKTLRDVGFDGDIVENGDTFEENALIKARAVSAFAESSGIDCIVIADDTGLCVNALDGAPGIFSARYSGGGYEDNCVKLLGEMKDREDRSAVFVCVAAMGHRDRYLTYRGEVPGRIAYEMLGTDGFGYDPVFIEDSTGLTYAQMGEDEKNRIGHRKRAFEGIRPFILEELREESK
ncbi:MAG: RdgB/HAM1 family non-canonical purine NTP pyrophosphatase [Eubacteriaceae bacterium]|nr:RdgB/HAM1 family non-canonical purine NTP pyrophosphatase [Eubacteriaceae bacterium]